MLEDQASALHLHHCNRSLSIFITFAPSDRLPIHGKGSGIFYSELDQHGLVVMLRWRCLESHLEQMDALLNGQAGNATAKLIQHALLVLTASILGAGCI